MKVWIVSHEWNQPPSEVTGDTGIVGVFADEGPAIKAAHAERLELEKNGETVYQFSMLAGRHCLACGQQNMVDGTPHDCDESPETEDFCDYCGAALKEDGTCDNDHDDWTIDVHCTEHEVQESRRFEGIIRPDAFWCGEAESGRTARRLGLAQRSVVRLRDWLTAWLVGK